MKTKRTEHLKFGIFDPFWDNQPNHLPLLSLRVSIPEHKPFNLRKSLRLIDEIISKNSSDDIYRDINLMLSDRNWRLHLVSCVTILKLDTSDQLKFIGFLWKRLCLYSWVSPQLLVTLSKIDANFKEKSAFILHDMNLDTFRLNYLNEDELSKVEYKYGISDYKILNALKYLNNEDPFLHVNDDDDDGGGIARNWDHQLIELELC